MRRISSSLTWWHKKAFPVFWFGFLGVWTSAWTVGVIRGEAEPAGLLVGAFLAALGYFLMRFLIFPLADEVFIDNDEIVVRNRSREDRFPILNIINVESSQFVNPERVTLMLRHPCIFGSEIAFEPGFRWWRFGRHPIAEELIRRIHHRDALKS
jgi:hypothetical protein